MPWKKDKRPFVKLDRLLASRKIGQRKLAEILGCSEVTAWRRLNDVGELRVKDLYTIMNSAHITKEEMKEAL